MTHPSWNILHGGGTRLSRIVEEVSAYDADVIALTEYRTKPGAPLCAALAARGWQIIASTSRQATTMASASCCARRWYVPGRVPRRL
jgi:endonuclease/exonuclease/phosphatase family metal-dependent hydrolase